MAQFTYTIGPDTQIKFAEKPADEIRALLKGAGFQWSPVSGCWRRRGYHGAADFLTKLDRKMNPDRPDGACWACKAPRGFFRQQGAATPVLCDECYTGLKINPPVRLDRKYGRPAACA